MITTAKETMITLTLMPGWTEIIGAVKAPPSAARKTPNVKAIQWTRFTLTPMLGAHLVIVDHREHDLAGDGAVEAEPDRDAADHGEGDEGEVVADIEQRPDRRRCRRARRARRRSRG